MVTRRAVLKSVVALAAPVAAAPARQATFPTSIANRVEFAFRTPGKNPNGLQATGEGLWILDQGTNRAALVRYADGSVVREFATATDRGSGITFDGEALWIASTYDRRLVRVDAQTGRTLKQFDSPGSGVVKWGPRGTNPRPTGAHGLEWRAGRLWVAVPPAVAIFVVNPEDGSVLRSFAAPGIRPHGIAWDPDGSLWCAESLSRSFFKMNPKTGVILRQVMLPAGAPEVDGLVHVPHGMTIWDRHFWFCVAETGEAYRVPLPTT